jgi:arylsulfatase A-like enzyme
MWMRRALWSGCVRRAIAGMLLVSAIGCLPGAAVAADRPPNILWISAEDLSADTLGCYGGPAHTPRLDALARGGLRFDAAFSAAPVCAPSRSAIITGVMPTTLGSLPMRCRATPPTFVAGLPRLLRAAGYYCTNNAKTDYNFDRSFDADWHESSGKAHWRKRPDPAQPFFAVFNFTVTHESGLFGDKAAEPRSRLPAAARRRAADVRVPPCYPDTPVVREALSARQELAAALDADVGRVLDELAADGLADDTIVFFWGDHGEGIPHGKRSLTEHGLRVPLLVHVPPRFTTAKLPGGGAARGATANLVSLMDLGPTALDLAAVAIPEWMEGRSFLGGHAVARDVVLAARDRMDAAPGFGRSVRDGRFRYVRHFLPWIDGDDLPAYADGVPITGELRAARRAGTLPAGAAWFSRTSRPAEELHDAPADPYEVRDLAALPESQADLVRLREALRAWMRSTRDTGILPEPLLRREAARAGSEWGIFHPADPAAAAAALARYDAILATAWSVADGHPAGFFATRLADREPAVRYWAACGTGWAAARADDGGATAERLVPLLADEEPVVRIAAAEWLLRSRAASHADAALDVLAAEMRAAEPEVRMAALVTIDGVGPATRSLWREAAALEFDKTEEYSRRTVERIRGKLGAVAPAGATN